MVRWLALLWLALSGCGGAAPAPAPGITRAPPSPAPAAEPAPAEAPAAAPGRPWLWEVRPAGGGEPSFLLGTIHLGVPLTDALPGGHGERLARARVVIVEMDTVSGAEDMLPLMTLPAGASLRRMIPAPTWERLRREVAVAESALDRL